MVFAVEVSARAASFGFDWTHPHEVLDKVREEADEIAQALAQGSPSQIYEELGDLLFSVANLARKLGLDPERALIDATQKFSHRFQHVERLILACAQRNDPPPTLAQMEDAWRAAKSLTAP